MYDNNGHGTRDYSEALEWLQATAQAGNPDSQFNLGKLYASGNGIPQDPVEAYFWMSLSLKQTGNAMDREECDSVGKSLTPAQKNRVERRLAEFVPHAPQKKKVK